MFTLKTFLFNMYNIFFFFFFFLFQKIYMYKYFDTIFRRKLYILEAYEYTKTKKEERRELQR